MNFFILWDIRNFTDRRAYNISFFLCTEAA
ncbi:hypothetical protein BOSE62_50272 [Bosea sp. 62]|nr:hypothetical protein BOSE21B_100282 [Bosea sp. 21B]CAD5284630.1 hypothetical protein BOSE7B_41249 [Bosea sp. 7B]CAD5301685.1 hypothetical protein BOSE46_90647 [Bosea sp. 46]VVT57806.1 hypothetical protein BOS5A_200281 [Bosea sp. EC-HK365B]VXB31675.1 hypothetical protein BOSE29B_100088 [Bosea sp. 29B]VXB75508.1 hypothetical protein BOSE125_150088 [Bosea sp. 125]VXC62847.1 hypothetical protein BOSE62_50272 [Bosea sp. 62]VXC91827.1 hypothetical protein BOSE127_80033 [Bosea sp. 127]